MTTATAERPKIATVFADSMGHDIMAFILNKLRTMPDHWARMNQEMQEKAIAEMRESVTNIVQQSAAIVMRAGFQAVGCELDGIQIKDEVKIGLTMDGGDPSRHALYDAKGRKVLLVLVDVAQWTQRMEELKSDKGQLDMLESDATTYNPARDQPKYRRDEDRTAPVGLTWAELREKLNHQAPAAASAEVPQKTIEQQAQAGLEGVIIVWPTGAREPLAKHTFSIESGETLVQALERAFPGCTFETLPADPLEITGANLTERLPGLIQMRTPATDENEAGPWGTYDAEEGQQLEVEDDQTVRQALELLYPGMEFRFVPDPPQTEKDTETQQDGAQVPESGVSDAGKDIPPATGEDGEPLLYGSAALPQGADVDASDLLERLAGIGMTINLHAVKLLMPEQRAHTRRWLGDWLDAFERDVPLAELPARPHFLPLFEPPARTPKSDSRKKRNRKP